MATPLQLLRDCITVGKPIALEGNELVLGGVRVPRGTLTNYKFGNSFYPLDAVWFFYENRKLENTSYIQECRSAGFVFISRVDRIDILNYLTGEIATSSKIDDSFIGDDNWLILKGLKRPSDLILEPDKDSTKKPRLDSTSTAASDSSLSRQPKETASLIETAVALQKHERRLRDRTTILLSDSKSFDFVEKILRDLNEAVKHTSSAKDAAKHQPPSQRPSKPVDNRINAKKPSSSQSVPKSASARVQVPPPIIIVPSTSSLITLYNVKEFLEDGKFVDSNEKRSSGVKREVMVTINRRNPPEGQPSTFQVVDVVTRLKPEDWSRVVGVFVQGPLWQFKDFPDKWKKPADISPAEISPADIFSHVSGFHVNYEDTKLDPNIQKWNVTILLLHRSKRHLDATAQEKFWQKIDSWILQHRPRHW